MPAKPAAQPAAPALALVPPQPAPAPAVEVINGTHVLFRASAADPVNGNWRTVEVQVPVGADQATINRAFDTWDRISERFDARYANGAAVAPAPAKKDFSPLDYRLTFTDWKGHTLGEIMEKDKGTVEWLAREARSDYVRRMAQDALQMAADAANTGASYDEAATAPHTPAGFF